MATALTARRFAVAAAALAARRGTSSLRRPYSKRAKGISLTPLQEEQAAGILAKTEVVADEARCAEIVAGIMGLPEEDAVVGVDMEGVELPNVGLVQIKTAEDKIFLLRTGRNPRLMTDGGLKDLLESTLVTKVFHGTTSDFLGIYKEGVSMWGVYDTALAHKVIEYQNTGKSVVQTNIIGYNNMCRHYGVETNPAKNFFDGTLYKRVNEFTDCDDLSEDLVLYSAADVDRLIELFEITRSMIEPDFFALLDDATENEMLRAVDPKQLAVRKSTRGQVEEADLFLSGLAPGLNKADVYALLAAHEGYRKVHFANQARTAHVFLQDRKAAVRAFQSLQDPGFNDAMGPEARVSLVTSLRASEVEEALAKGAEAIGTSNVSENHVVDNAVTAAMVDRILRARCPVVLEFHLHSDSTTVSAFVGRSPILEFPLNHGSLTKGRLGDLLSSEDVPKILNRVDSNNVHSGLKIAAASNFAPGFFFDVSCAFRAISYLQSGNSIFKSMSPAVKDILWRMGLGELKAAAASRHEQMLYAYLRLQQVLPAEILELLREKVKCEVCLGSHVEVAAAKEARKTLRSRMETLSVHVVCERGPRQNLASVLKKYMHDRKLPYTRVIAVAAGTALIETKFFPDVPDIVRDLQFKTVDGLVLTASPVDVRSTSPAPEVVPSEAVRLLVEKAASGPEILDRMGFFELASQPTRKEAPDSSSSPADEPSPWRPSVRHMFDLDSDDRGSATR